jgi:hypothetical protein
VGAYHEYSLSRGSDMPNNCETSASMPAELWASTEWSKCELEKSVAEGIARYREAAATARQAFSRWRRLGRYARELKYADRYEDYRLARAKCEAQRVALNHLIDQLGYVPRVPTSH